MGHRSPHQWPARRIDLTLSDFFLWGWLKEQVYSTKPTTLQELKAKMREVVFHLARVKSVGAVHEKGVEASDACSECWCPYEILIKTFYPIHHHHHVALVARISLTLSRHSSLSFIALGRSSGQHPVSSHSCWMYVRAGRPAFARPCVGVHKSTSLISSSLLLQQCHPIKAFYL